MIDRIATGDPHVVGIHVAGSVTNADVEEVIRILEDTAAEQDNISFVAVIDALEGMSPAALFKDITYGIKQLKHLDRFERAAIVTDMKWVRIGAKLEKSIVPNIEVNVFSKKSREKALEWVRGGHL